MNFKKFFSFSNLIFLTLIIGLTVGLILVYINTQKTVRDAYRLADISKIQAGLSIFLSERNRYPVGENLFLGGLSARVLCLPTDFRDL